MNRVVSIAAAALVAVLVSRAAYAVDVEGKVNAVMGERVMIEVGSPGSVNAGDEVSVGFTTPDGDYIPVGKWRVESVSGSTITAEKVEAMGPANVGMRAIVHASAAPKGSAAYPTKGGYPSKEDYPSKGGGSPKGPPPVSVESDAENAYRTGLDYRHGTAGVAKDLPKALWFFEQAAVQGHVKAINEAGYAYQNGRGTQKDYAEAMRWYRRAADKGDGEALNNVAYMYVFGMGVDKDYTEAMYWLKRAAETGYGWAYNNLGAMYEFGYGTPHDFKRSIEYYEMATREGIGRAYFNLGYMHERGCGVAADSNKAMELYNKAASSGIEKAKERVAKAVQHERFGDGFIEARFVWDEAAPCGTFHD